MKTIRRTLMLLVLSGLLPATALPQPTTANRANPNIIFILADDLGWGELGCYGSDKIKTPNIDRLAAEGMRFTSAYCGTSVCAPSRAALMTGLHMGHNPIRANREIKPEGQMPLPSGTVTVAQLLKDAGYKTATTGKWGLGFPGSGSEPTDRGFDFSFGYNCQREAHHYYPKHLWRNKERIELDGKTYSHDLITEETLKWVKENAAHPFFLYLAFTIPHAQYEVPDLGIYADRDWPEGEKRIAAMITRMDQSIGRLLALLRQTGADRNTLILFASDNGAMGSNNVHQLEFFNSNGPWRGFKRSMYEGGLRVPAIAWWPGRIKAGQVNDTPWAFWDFLPTAVDVAGAKLPKSFQSDGVSIKPLLLGKPQPQRAYFYWELHERFFQQALRMGDWKAVRPAIDRPVELYNLKTDSREEHDVAVQHSDLVRKMTAMMVSARTESADWPIKTPPTGGGERRVPAKDVKEEVKNNPPQISSVFPQGARSGSQLEVIISGQNLSRTTKIIFSEPGVSARLLKTANTKVRVKLEVAPDASVGPHYFRLVTPRGSSNLLIFRVGDLPETEEAEPNDTFEKANRIQAPVTINGRMAVDEDIDMYRLRVEAGERLIFDLVAARNGSGGDLALTLLDARGHIVKHSEDHFLWDPFISLTFKEAAEYFLAIRPLDGRGNPDFAYQLTIRPGPYLASIFPLGAQRGTSHELVVRGQMLAGAKRIEAERNLSQGGRGLELKALSAAADKATVQMNVAKDAPLGVHRLRLSTQAGWSNPVKFLVGDLPDLIEAEPNDAPAQLQRVSPPASINGRIERKGDVDRFAFTVGVSEQLVFEVKAEELGSPLDTHLTLYNDKGSELASNDDAEPNNRLNRDARLEFTFKEAGDYSLAIRDLSRLGGPDYGYRLTIRKPAPSFSLSFDTDRPIVERGGAGTLKITAKRWEGFDGEIALEVLGLPKVISASQAVIKKGETQASIGLKCESGAPLEVFSIRVAGEAKINDQAINQFARIQARVSGIGPGYTTAQVVEVPLAITEPVHFNLEVGATNVPLVRGGSAEFTVTAKRRAGFKTAIALLVENLPPGVTAEAAQIGEDNNHALVKLRASEGANVGRYLNVTIVGKAKVGEHDEVEQAPRVSLKID
jgi:arylsulfatase A